MSKDYKDLESYSDVYAYLKNDLSKHERKQFEEAINEDSFLKEAVAGFSLISAEELDLDFKSLHIKKTGSASELKAVAIMFIFIVIIVFVAYWWFLKPESKDESFDNGSVSSYSDEPIQDEESIESVVDSSGVFFVDKDTLDVKGLEKPDDSSLSLKNNASEKPDQGGSVQRKSVEKSSDEKDEKPARTKPRRVEDAKTKVEKVDTSKRVDADSIYSLMNGIDVVIDRHLLDTKSIIISPKDSLLGGNE